MIKISCKFCGIPIYWLNIDGKGRPFEDDGCTIPHNCPNLKKSKSAGARVAKLEEFSNTVSVSEDIAKIKDDIRTLYTLVESLTFSKSDETESI